MKWILKALIQKLISPLPGNSEINYFFQSKIRKFYPVTDKIFLNQIHIAIRHRDFFIKNQETLKDWQKARFFEMGPGWDLIIPLTFHVLGFRDQTLVDIRNNLKFPLVRDTLQRLQLHLKEIEKLSNGPCKPAQADFPPSLGKLKEAFGIQYLSGIDAKSTGLKSDSFDFISSTSVFEHIRKEDICPTIQECRRLLKKGGIISMIVDLQDHFAQIDPSLSHHSFLRYPDPVWNLITSKFNYVNRLRFSDYLELFQTEGFEILHQDVYKAKDEELDFIRKMEIASCFKKYSLEELGGRVLTLVVKKK